MYYFDTKHMVEKIITSNQLTSVVEMLSFHVNKVHVIYALNK